MTVATQYLDAVVRREHADPHSVLGAHSLNDSVVVRAHRQAARAVSAYLQDGSAVEYLCHAPSTASGCRARGAGATRSTPTPTITAEAMSATSDRSCPNRFRGTVSRSRRDHTATPGGALASAR